MPIFFTFLVVAIVLDNLIRIFHMIDQFNEYFWLRVPVFRLCAGLCILTQVLNPTLAWFEEANPAQIAQGQYEHNALYFTRNSLTSIAILTLSGYIVEVGGLLNHELQKEKLFSGVRKRVLAISVLMEVVLCLRLVMIWSQNYFWYSQDQALWLIFVLAYQLSANILPLGGFLVVVAYQVTSLKKSIIPKQDAQRVEDIVYSVQPVDDALPISKS